MTSRIHGNTLTSSVPDSVGRPGVGQVAPYTAQGEADSEREDHSTSWHSPPLSPEHADSAHMLNMGRRSHIVTRSIYYWETWGVLEKQVRKHFPPPASRPLFWKRNGSKVL